MSLIDEGADIYQSYPYRSLTTRPFSITKSPLNVVSQTSTKPTSTKKVVKPEDTLPTPRPSIDDHNRLRREELLGNVYNPRRKVTSDPLEITRSLGDVSEKDFEWLKGKGEAGEIPGWENLRIDYMSRLMIVKYPTWQHESLNDVVTATLRELNEPRIRVGGAPDLDLLKGLGCKCPDIVLCDRDDRNHAGFPTVAFEIGYSQSQAALNYNAARLLFGSGGKINAVVTVKVSLNENSTLSYLGIDVWRMTIREVDEDGIEGIERDAILTKENKLADSRLISWSFSFFTTEGDTLFHLKAEPIHYQIYPKGDKGRTIQGDAPRFEKGPIVLDEVDLFRFASLDDIVPFTLTLDSDLIIQSFETGIDYENKSKVKNRFLPNEVKKYYGLKSSMTAKRSLAAMISSSHADDDRVRASGDKNDRKGKRAKLELGSK